jgi:hypothetical protein
MTNNGQFSKYSSSSLICDQLLTFFQKVAKDNADAYLKDNPNTVWCNLRIAIKEEITTRINTELVEKDISPVEKDVVAWKMSTLMRDTVRLQNSIFCSTACCNMY